MTAQDTSRREIGHTHLPKGNRAAKYLTGEPATFEEGAWTGDGVFDQLDIVAALQTGNYLQGPYAARVVDAAFATIDP